MTTITALPTPPSRLDPANFATRADAFHTALPTFATEANALAAEVSNNAAVAAAAAQAVGIAAWVSGTTYAIGDCRYDTTNFLTYRRKTAGAGTTRPGLDGTNWQLLTGFGDVDSVSAQDIGGRKRFTDAITLADTVTVASAATTNIVAALSNIVIVSGTTTITSLGTPTLGIKRTLVFAGALVLTHNATTLILPGGANITTAAGDSCEVVPNGNPATGWRVVRYTRNAVSPDASQTSSSIVANGAGTANAITATFAPAITALTNGLLLCVRGASANTTTAPTFSPNGLTVKSIVKGANTPLMPGDIAGAGHWLELQFDTTLDKWVLLNPAEGTAAPSQIQTINATVAANALTLTLNPTVLDFRSNSLASGVVNTRQVTAAINLVVSSGSTLGTVNATAARLAVLAIDNAGTVELAVTNLSGGVNLDETTLISTTAEGGAGAADSASVIYSTTARTNVPFRVVGFIDITQATAGTWVTAPSEIQGAGGQAGIPLAMNAMGAAPMFACRAWVNFNGTGTVAIRASGNVSSITDNGVGDYTVNFATAMPDANYAPMAQSTPTDGSSTRPITYGQTVATQLAASWRLRTHNFSAFFDPEAVTVSIFR